MLKITPTDLPEVKILEYEKYPESRGCSYSSFSKKELQRVGIETDFIEENVYCRKGQEHYMGYISKTIPWHRRNYFIASKEEDLILQLT